MAGERGMGTSRGERGLGGAGAGGFDGRLDGGCRRLAPLAGDQKVERHAKDACEWLQRLRAHALAERRLDQRRVPLRDVRQLVELSRGDARLLSEPVKAFANLRGVCPASRHG